MLKGSSGAYSELQGTPGQGCGQGSRGLQVRGAGRAMYRGLQVRGAVRAPWAAGQGAVRGPRGGPGWPVSGIVKNPKGGWGVGGGGGQGCSRGSRKEGGRVLSEVHLVQYRYRGGGVGVAVLKK